MFEEQKTIALRKPLLLGTGENAITYAELKLREPTAGEIAKAQIGAHTDTDTTLNLLCAVAGIPRKAADQLCQRDLRTVAAFFGQDSDDGEPAAGQS